MLKRFFSVLLAMFVSVIGFFPSSSLNDILNKGDITGRSDLISVDDRDLPDFEVGADGIFTVLQITDTHFFNGIWYKDTKTLFAIKEQIIALKPDLVIATGDIFDGYNDNIFYNKYSAIAKLAFLFEELEQYWAYIPGNNDGEFKGSADDIAACLAEYGYCLLSDVPDLSGAANYTLSIKSGGETVHSLLLTDSGMRDETGRHRAFQPDQVEWAARTLSEIKAVAPGAKVSVFYHANTPAFCDAGASGSAYKAGYGKIPADLDNNGVPENTPIDEALRGSGIVTLVSVGHYHPSVNWCSLYESTYYHLTRASGYQATNKPGAALINIDTNGTAAQEIYTFTEIVF